MLPTDNSLLFLFLGKDSPWLPWILLAFLLIQKGSTIWKWIEDKLSMRYKEYVLSGCFYINKKYATCHGQFSDEMEAFLHFLQISKLPLKKCIVMRTGGCIVTESESITIPSKGLWIHPHLYAKFNMEKSQTRFKEDSDPDNINTAQFEEHHLTITLQSTVSFEYIRTFLKDCMEAHKIFKEKRREKLQIVKPSLSRNVENTHYIPFNSNKTFDNLFFKGKDALLERLEQFKCMKGDCIAARLGLPSTLGLLFYGEPGCGKTSAIKAIANYMRMNLILVPMNKIRTRRDLERLFYSTDVCWIPLEKRIYVFEEIDCNGWENIVLDRRFHTPTVDTPNDTKMIELLDSSVDSLVNRVVEKKQKKEEEERDRLTLGAILEILDGVVESPGRIVIMTTNRRGMLDPALIRPGRIDMEIEFGRLRRCDIAAIYERMWGIQIEPDFLEQIPERYTQAEIAQFLYTYKDPHKFVTALIGHEKIN